MKGNVCRSAHTFHIYIVASPINSNAHLPSTAFSPHSSTLSETGFIKVQNITFIGHGHPGRPSTPRAAAAAAARARAAAARERERDRACASTDLLCGFVQQRRKLIILVLQLNQCMLRLQQPLLESSCGRNTRVPVA